MDKRKFLFYYLDTGAGHKSAANVLSDAMKNEQSDADVKIVRGFSSHGLGHLLFEKGYNYSCNYIHGLFPIVYDLGQSKILQSVLTYLLCPETKRFLRKQILKEHPTDIVSFHFVLLIL